MANYQAILRLRPEVSDFIRHRRWVHRGDVVAYGPNIQCESFSTDPAGFRNSTFRGETLAVSDCIQRDRYGLVLGPSSVYGFGLAGNENTMPSLLAERFGFPFANVGLPEGNSRNLHSLLLAFLGRAKRRPAAVVHVSGGDFTSFCYTSIVDPVFGSPNLKQIQMAVSERGGAPDPEQQIGALLAFSSLWTGAIANVCRSLEIPLIIANDTTFFEKDTASVIERDSELGSARSAAQERQFATHRKFVAAFHDRRKQLSAELGVPLVGPGITNDLGFIDEFHYDRDGMRALCDDFAAALAPLLARARPA